MTTVPIPKARFSTGIHPLSSAPSFTWEVPVPITPFWDTISYPSARNFINCFSAPELDALDLETHSSLANAEKATLLIGILEEKIKALEKDNGNDDASGKKLYEIDNKKWLTIQMGIAALYAETSSVNLQIATCELMIRHQADKTNLSHQHALAALLTKRGEEGDWQRAEELERPVTGWLEGKLGREAPQCLSSRRILAKAIWKLGRVEEARGLVGELEGIVEGMGGGEYGVYQDCERRWIEEMVEELEGREKAKGQDMES